MKSTISLCQDGDQLHSVSSGVEVFTRVFETHDTADMLGEDDSRYQTEASTLDGSRPVGRMPQEFTPNRVSTIKTIFSPLLEPFKPHNEPDVGTDPEFMAGNITYPDMPMREADESDNNQISYDNKACNFSDLFISDVLIASLPFNENALENIFSEISPLPDYKLPEPSMLFDVADQYMMLPFLEDKSSNTDDVKSDKDKMVDLDKDKMVDLDNHDIYLGIDQMVDSQVNSDSEQADDFDPQLFIKNQPELSDVVSNFWSNIVPKESGRRKSVTLVLDLDETLVHSTLEHCDDAAFTFPVFFNMKEHTVYVKQRPYLYRFLERVAEMFRVIIFTASQSIYASQLLDILDPDGKFISQRFYRESCILLDGIYTKDLTVLDLDLAKVVMIDNFPQVFRLQANNGIPIKSWYDDPSDDGLVSLLPFLETLVDADDVRPIIAERFGNVE